MKNVKLCLGIIALLLFSCVSVMCKDDKAEPVTPGGNVNNGNNDTPEDILSKVGAVKTMNTYDEEACWSYGKNMTFTVDRAVKKEGTGSFRMQYSFKGTGTADSPEYTYIGENWGDFRSDLSFSPLGVSVWIKGKSTNKGVLRFVLIEDDAYPTYNLNKQYFQFTDKEILQKEGWNRLVNPYASFKRLSGPTGEMKLSRISGYRIDVVNPDKVTATGEFYIDKLEQLTSYKPYYKKPKFSSIFVQLTTDYVNEDWTADIKALQAVGIDTLIVQYAQGYGDNKYISWYSGSTLPWVTQQYPILENLMNAARTNNFKVIMGLYGGDFDHWNLSEPTQYTELYDRNKKIIDEIYTKFGQNTSLVGWYITQEFHDGTYPDGWVLSDAKRDLLAGMLEGVASYTQTKARKMPVAIAPALYRGLPADKTGDFYRKLFQKTPSITNLYLQDCAGRCNTDVDVDLPNYYEQVKKACQETGVQFGVDIESFLNCWCPVVNYQPKTWDELSSQLFMAGLYTQNITNFSWVTFKPGQAGYDGYKRYLQENGMLPK